MAYDSRSDKPRTRHNHLYCRNESTAPPEPVTEAQAVAEGLDELDDDLDRTDYAMRISGDPEWY